MLAADNWCVKVDDRIYGPYSSQQLRKFAHEGRLAAFSLVAPAGSRAFKEARDEASFASFFGESARVGAPERAFGKRDSTAAQATTTSGAASFVIIFDTDSGVANRVETAIQSLGPAFRLASNVWAVTCDLTAVGVRNVIAPYLLPKEQIFVVDATRGRSSWQNFAPELHAKIAACWALAKA